MSKPPDASLMNSRDAPAILVIRRDNIGDLVCTTPLLTALRNKYPRSWIAAWVNSYNAPVLDRNPDIDEVIVYTKLKHLESGESALTVLGKRLLKMWQLRRRKLDYVVIATPSFVPRTANLARILAPRHVIGFGEGILAQRRLDIRVPQSKVEGLHEVERVFTLARHMGVSGPIPPLKVVPDADAVARARKAFGERPATLRVGIQISSRRPAQRWPADYFTALIRRVHAIGAASLLLWSPGPANHPRHPGDDEKAAAIAANVGREVSIVAYRTPSLPDLIGALSLCDAVVTSDGGAMHLAAALGKPTVCFFGDSLPERWRPWGVPHRILQSPTGNVAGISVDEAFTALKALLKDRS